MTSENTHSPVGDAGFLFSVAPSWLVRLGGVLGEKSSESIRVIGKVKLFRLSGTIFLLASANNRPCLLTVTTCPSPSSCGPSSSKTYRVLPMLCMSDFLESWRNPCPLGQDSNMIYGTMASHSQRPLKRWLWKDISLWSHLRILVTPTGHVFFLAPPMASLSSSCEQNTSGSDVGAADFECILCRLGCPPHGKELLLYHVTYEFLEYPSLSYFMSSISFEMSAVKTTLYWFQYIQYVVQFLRYILRMLQKLYQILKTMLY